MVAHLSPLAAYPARPGQSLADHLAGVVENIQRLVDGESTTTTGDDWQTVLEVIGWLHDAGKLTSWFGTYLETGSRSHAPRPKHTHHGFVSALLTAHALYNLDVSERTRNAAFYAVAKHHGVLPALETADQNYVGNNVRADTRFGIASDQLQNIDAQASEAANALVQHATNGNLTWDQIFVEQTGQYQQLLTNLGAFDDRFYETVLRAWSTLVCADKLDAAGVTVPRDAPRRPPLAALQQHVAALPDGETPLESRMNTLRSRAHETAHERLIDGFDAGDRLFEISLPTGFGKTLTGLRAGLELAERRDGRLIYALPYTSIIDQVDGVCQRSLDVAPGDRAYTIHHHLADTRTDLTTLNDAEGVNDGSESLYAETWQAGLVLTTFTQLLESVAGPGNTQSMKLPALQNSTIILDEPQAVPLRWWGLVGRLADFLIREYDATIILMTATQPRILERTPDLPTPTPLTPEYDACIEFIKSNPRVEFHLHESVRDHLDGGNATPLPIADAASTLRRATLSGSTTLAIVNTIESAARMTDALRTTQGAEDAPVHLADAVCAFWQETTVAATDPGTQAQEYLEFLAERTEAEPGARRTLLATLTTRLRPRDRQLLLGALRQLLDSEQSTPFDDYAVLTVSTQLIEAGVDLSFDRLFRDFAPLSALVQAAGRCNRAFDGDIGTVTVWRLAGPEPNDQVPSNLIYGQDSLLRPTRTALDALRDDTETITESALISEGVKKYYQALHAQRQTTSRSDSLAASFNTGNGDRLREASLIDEQYETREIALLVSDKDREQYHEYVRLKQAEKWTAAAEAFDALKPLLISVPVAEDQPDAEEIVSPIDVTNAPEQYEIETGRGITLDATAFDTER
jgi:CRISPR-associated endonuclease Cas3-HD